ncbi:site-2 protease family protein [Candidatus Gottesmanbacteria bacterium]|nr:site-2 protease family protein [Candidatus Gottesmanbacteria bacterium]
MGIEFITSFIIQVLVFLFILSILVLVHELGHFLTARLFGIRVDEFGFGLPPRIWGKKIGETVYSINALPIGGFVKLFGEEGEAENPKSEIRNPKVREHAFYARPWWQRSLVLIAGVSMNFLLAVVVLSILLAIGTVVSGSRIHIGNIAANSPAEQANLQKNDVIVALNAETISKSEQLVDLSRKHLGEEVTLTISRGMDFSKPVRDTCQSCNIFSLKLTPRKDAPAGEGPLGITISDFEERKYAWYEAPFYGFREALVRSRDLVVGLAQLFAKLIAFEDVRREVAGPIGIFQVTGEVMKYGGSALLTLLTHLSLTLAFINILPFPALDGGRLLFVAIEAVTGKRVHAHHERALHQIGMIVLLFLILMITINDIARLVHHNSPSR